MVGLVRWCRNHPRIKENLSGGVGLVCGMECGIFQFCADVQRAGSRRPLHPIRFATLRQSNLVQRDNKGRCSRYLDRDLVGVDADRFTQVLDERPT
jgi:hypothetical protein